jgi:hypothetical protein
MRRLFCTLLIIISGFFTVNAQSGTPFYSKKFNWNIVLPEGFQVMTEEESQKMKARGEKAIEDTYQQDIEDRTTPLFMARLDKLQYMEANYQPFNEKKDGPYAESCEAVYNLLLETFQAQIPDAVITTSRGVKRVSGLDFLEYRMVIELPNKINMYLYMYNRLIDNADFTFNVVYVDQQKGELMKKAFFESTFAAK